MEFNQPIPTPEAQAPQQPTPPKKKKHNAKNLLDGSLIITPQSRKLLPFLLFVVGLVVIYIWLTYNAVKIHKEINYTKKEIKELRFEYITIKSQFMDSTKQSRLSRKLHALGIQESRVPPEKIIVTKNEFASEK